MIAVHFMEATRWIMPVNEDFQSILLFHLQRYPKLQAQDLFKLVYQSEFAGGHLIDDETGCLERLLEETRLLPASPDDHHLQDLPLFEDIGSGLCRMNLAKAFNSGVEWATINKFFVMTAASVTGSCRSFKNKLTILRRFIKDHALPYSLADLDDLAAHYDFLEHPPVSHSAEYRQAYVPAYRVVKSTFRDFFEVFCRIDRLLRIHPAIRVAIDGMCGSGKSTLADLLKRVYGCDIIHMDHFFLPPELRTPERFTEMGGNVDYSRFIIEVAPGLQSGRPFQYQAFDCIQMAMGKAIQINPGRLAVVEGSYSMHPKLSGLYDLKIFLEIDPEEQSKRILKREGPRMFKRFAKEWIPMENRYFKEMHIRENSDLILKHPRFVN
jgi:uridine kinase